MKLNEVNQLNEFMGLEKIFGGTKAPPNSKKQYYAILNHTTSDAFAIGVKRTYRGFLDDVQKRVNKKTGKVEYRAVSEDFDKLRRVMTDYLDVSMLSSEAEDCIQSEYVKK